MSIDTSSIGVYSPDTVYGQLTMPFFNKPVTINAHTEFDEEGEEQTVLTKDKFYNNKSKMQVSIEDIRDMKGLELDENIAIKVGPEYEANILANNAIPSFQLSNYTKGSGVVIDALQKQYTVDKAVLSGQAFNAYNSVSANDFAKTIQHLSSIDIKVK